MQNSISRESSKIYQSLLGQRIYKEENLNYYYYYCFMMMENEECLHIKKSLVKSPFTLQKNERSHQPVSGPESED